MAAPAPSKLDSSQILPASFDEATGRLRVDTEAVVNIDGEMEVALDHTEDSVKVGDGTDFLQINADGTIDIKNVTGTVASLSGPTTGTITSVSRSATSQTALASNAARKGAIFHNDSMAVCYLAYSATATTALYTVRLTSQSTHIIERHDYTGVVAVIWGSGGAGALVITGLA